MTKTQTRKLDKLVNELGQLRDELQEAFDEMSEKAQEGEKGQTLESEISTLTDAIDGIEQNINLSLD